MSRFTMPPGMAQALRMVRAGALKEAMTAIQAGLRGDAAPEPHAAADAPAEAVAGGRFVSRSHANAAGTRAYRLYIPGVYRGEPLPLVVMLHGCTQSPDDFAAGTRMNELAEREGLLVAYPAQPASANPNRCWNWFPRAQQRRGEGEPSLIAGIVQAVRAELAVREGAVFVAGLSSGGAMAATLGATYPELFAAIGVHSGLAYGSAHDLPSGLAAMRAGAVGAAVESVPAIVFHGDRDTLVHPRNGEAIAAQFAGGHGAALVEEAAGAVGGRRHTRRVLRDASGASRLEHWVLHGAGHAWSGGSPRGTHTDPSGPDASAEMVRFFLGRAAGT